MPTDRDPDRDPEADSPVAVPAGRIVGLLADPTRLRVVAALALGAAGRDDVLRTTGLPLRDVEAALGRLARGGLIELGRDGTIVLVEAVFAVAARAAAPPPPQPPADAPPGSEQVLAVFAPGGRLIRLPAAHGKRLVVLDWLAQRFELGRRYSEREVNRLLRPADDDVANLRRRLVDDGFLDRSAGEYWRSGGTVRR